MAFSRQGLAVRGFLLIVSGIAIGLVIGFFSGKNSTSDQDQDHIHSLTREADKTISKKLLDEVKADNIREYLR